MLSHICVISDLLNLEIAFFRHEITETVQNLKETVGNNQFLGFCLIKRKKGTFMGYIIHQ